MARSIPIRLGKPLNCFFGVSVGGKDGIGDVPKHPGHGDERAALQQPHSLAFEGRQIQGRRLGKVGVR